MRVQLNSIETDELERRINHKRKNLIRVVQETGFNSEDTLLCSQKLDELITVYQKREMKKIMCD